MCVTRHDVDEGRHSKQASKEGRKGKNSERVSKCLHPHAKDAWHQGRRFLFRKERDQEDSITCTQGGGELLQVLPTTSVYTQVGHQVLHQRKHLQRQGQVARGEGLRKDCTTDAEA